MHCIGLVPNREFTIKLKYLALYKSVKCILLYAGNVARTCCDISSDKEIRAVNGNTTASSLDVYCLLFVC